MFNEMVITNCDIVVNEYINPYFKHYIKNKTVEFNNDENYLQLIGSTFSIGLPWNKLFKKEVLTEKFNENVSIEMSNFGLSNMINAKRISWLNADLYNYENDYLDNKVSLFDKSHLYESTLQVLQRKLSYETSNQIAYALVFDFVIWELLMYDKVGLLTEGVQIEVKEVFKEQQFIDSLTSKEKFGISYNPELSYSNELIEKFTILCMEANEKILSGNLNLVPFNVTACLFVKLFIIKNGIELNKDDLLASMFIELDENSTDEAKYVNQVLR